MKYICRRRLYIARATAIAAIVEGGLHRWAVHMCSHAYTELHLTKF